ncbi:MAG: hypothetical protein WCQ50_22815 [Spirochaetota bacterium]
MSRHRYPASLSEIAIAIGKSKHTIERMAKNGDWKYTEKLTHSRYKKRFFALKDLPSEISTAVLTKRLSGISARLEADQAEILTINPYQTAVTQELSEAEVIEELADKIVRLVRAETYKNGSDGLAESAVLLAQHRLFGALYLRQLFTGNIF